MRCRLNQIVSLRSALQEGVGRVLSPFWTGSRWTLHGGMGSVLRHVTEFKGLSALQGGVGSALPHAATIVQRTSREAWTPWEGSVLVAKNAENGRKDVRVSRSL